MEFSFLDLNRWESTFRKDLWETPERAELFLRMVAGMSEDSLNWETRAEGLLCCSLPTGILVSLSLHYKLVQLLRNGNPVCSLRVTPEFVAFIESAVASYIQKEEERIEAENKDVVSSLVNDALEFMRENEATP